MPTYQSPLDDYQLLLHHFLRVQERTDLPGFADLSPEFTLAILSSAARFHEEVFHPLNAAGDRQGARIENGHVTTPDGFAQAWAKYAECGWHRLALPEHMGGAGLPPLLSVPVSEMTVATGHSLGTYGGFCASAANMLSELGSDWMKEHVVPRLVRGDWTATMAMTESHCGTDLRQLRTRAEPAGDGTWRLSGTKIFITGADHDLTENIVHIVLAKVPDADGRVTHDLSAVHVFLVSKRDIDPHTGALGGRGNVSVSAIEHKMGIEGSATCVLHFDHARAWHIQGAQRTGSGSSGIGTGSSHNMQPMFRLMNFARLGTAISGFAYAELAYQNAAAYARDRQSGRAADGPRQPHAAADPIIVHPDVRRMLLDSRSFAEGARATALRIALYQSIAASSADTAERETAEDMVELMTPVMKAYFTDRGHEAATTCQQVLGGHGYIRDGGLEQMVRNARIGQLYEGANGVQAIDLVARKLRAHGGRARRSFRRCVEASVERCERIEGVAAMAATLRRSLDLLEATLATLDRHAALDPNAIGAAAYDLLTFYGTVALGWTWMDLAALACNGSLEQAGPNATQSKRVLAMLWFERQMPLLPALHERIAHGATALMTLSDSDV